MESLRIGENRRRCRRIPSFAACWRLHLGAVSTMENATNAAAFRSTCFLFMSKPLVCLLKLLNALLTLFTPDLWPQGPAPQSSLFHQHEENRNQNQYVNG